MLGVVAHRPCTPTATPAAKNPKSSTSPPTVPARATAKTAVRCARAQASTGGTIPSAIKVRAFNRDSCTARVPSAERMPLPCTSRAGTSATTVRNVARHARESGRRRGNDAAEPHPSADRMDAGGRAASSHRIQRLWPAVGKADRNLDVPGRVRVIRDPLPEFDQGRLYPSAEEALAALKAWIEGGEEQPKTEE